MEAILHEHNNAMPTRDVLTAIAEKFRCAMLFLTLVLSAGRSMSSI